ncbi:TetR/AcrR family transcriptional regulator [soil metagenome]
MTIANPSGRTRPRDRRQTILTTAAELFAVRGFHNVSTGDIADAVGISASALYRHVENKRDLLEQAVAVTFEPINLVLRDAAPTDIDGAIRILAEQFGDRRYAGPLWSRETRNLGDEARARVRTQFFEVRDSLADLLDDEGQAGGREDAQTRAMAVIAVLTSPGYHGTPLAPDKMMALIGDLAGTLARTPIPRSLTKPSPRFTGGGVPPASRQAVILDAATRLFSERGYQTVTMQDIGESMGVTGAGLYRHYDTKGELLTAIVTRGAEALHLDLSRSLAAASDPAEALELTVASYAEFGISHRELLRVLVTEIPNIPEPSRQQLLRAHRTYAEQWMALLASARPHLGATGVAFRVHSALTVVNDFSRTRRSAERADAATAVTALARTQLWNV